MKTNLFFMAAFLTMLLISCKVEKIEPNQVRKDYGVGFSQSNLSIYDVNPANIGLYHNQQLDAAFQVLRELKNSKSLSTQTVQEVVLNISFGELLEKEVNPIGVSQFAHSFISWLQSNRELGNKETQLTKEIESNPNYSKNFKAFFHQLLDKMNEVNEIQIARSTVAYFMELSEKSLSGEEKEFSQSCLNVYISSFEYWNSNLENWKSIGNNNNATCGPLAKADFCGAVGGGLAGATAGAVTLPIVGAVPGWVAGAASGALGASIVEGIGQLWDWVF